ncbi:hypothetical protein EAI_07458 [Harpegnathos saltator]|uniref:Uncharacterized protein n=1 Tax=Harpegnathos saltator TaxID=610380 RepID=E2B5C6_HARSA|nr:hypothetical protein EAI_07458 [Harpegnathos saltator]
MTGNLMEKKCCSSIIKGVGDPLGDFVDSPTSDAMAMRIVAPRQEDEEEETEIHIDQLESPYEDPPFPITECSHQSPLFPGSRQWEIQFHHHGIVSPRDREETVDEDLCADDVAQYDNKHIVFAMEKEETVKFRTFRKPRSDNNYSAIAGDVISPRNFSSRSCLDSYARTLTEGWSSGLSHLEVTTTTSRVLATLEAIYELSEEERTSVEVQGALRQEKEKEIQREKESGEEERKKQKVKVSVEATRGRNGDLRRY